MSNAALDQALEDILDSSVDVESSRGYDEPDMPSDLDEVVGRLTPSPASDPDWGKSPRQIEREAEAQRKEAGGAVKGCGLLELFGTEGLSDAQLGDLESDRAYQAELAEEAAAKAEAEARIAADPEHLEFAPELQQEAEQRNARATEATQQFETATQAELGQLDQGIVHLQQQYAQVEQAFAAAQQAGDQARMQQCQQAAADLQQRYAQAEQHREMFVQRADTASFAGQCEAEFRQRRPDYDRAADHVDESFEKMCAEKYPQATPELRAQVKLHVVLQFIQNCRLAGTNPAEQIYRQAQVLGYQSAGRPRAPAQVQPQQPVQQSVQPMAMPSLAQVAEMDADQFEQFWSQVERVGTVMPRGW